jgi:sigma-B regulation protein RsbU (phosphoserine phosphatase)
MSADDVARIHRLDALEERLARLRAFGSLRRSLRVIEEVEAIAAAAELFAREVLGVTCVAIYCGEKEASDFDLLAFTSESVDFPRRIERGSAIGEELEKEPSTRNPELLLPLGGSLGPEAMAFALRASPREVIGLVAFVGKDLDVELLAELAFDVESALSARMITSLRAEELAVLEIQERELVGLLRDVEARDEIIQRDLEEARQFQRRMLGAPPRVTGASVEVIYEPLGLVGGDLYAVSVDGNRLRLFVADATGHGVRASLTTMFIKSGYEAVRLAAPDPAALLAALNDAIAHTYRSAEMLFSAACVDIDLATGRVLSSSAAHPALCIVNGGEARFIEGGGAFLGLRTGMKFTTQEAVIEEGDGVYLHTDGFVEARKQNQLFGDERFRQAIIGAHRTGSLAGESVLAAVREFLEGTPLDDDGTFVGVRFGAAELSMVQATPNLDPAKATEEP